MTNTQSDQAYQVEYSPTFMDSVARSVEVKDQFLAQLWETVTLLAQKPFGTPRLQTHDVGNARNGKPVFSSDVGGRRSDRRLVWQVFNRTIVVLLYGKHKVQDQAKRMNVAFDPTEQRVVVTVQAESADEPEQSYVDRRLQAGRLFMAWGDKELADFGFGNHVAAVLRPLNTEDELFNLEDSMTIEDFTRAVNLLIFDHPDGESAALADLEARLAAEAAASKAMEPVATEEDLELERHLADPRGGAWFTAAEPEFLKDIINRPIEDWMVFLHPDQREIVTRTFNGPARVRGSAGTGKTVVGLHRAAHLAEVNRHAGNGEKILFTTFVKSLPPVFESLFERLPGTHPEEVDFIHIDKLAAAICRGAGDDLVTAPAQIDKAFETAWRRKVTSSSPLGQACFTSHYVREEITAVIKGRGLDSLDDYLDIARTGRRARMSKPQRSQVWELMQEWDSEMERAGTVDFADVVVRALHHARTRTAPKYSAAIIDEAQDLTLAGLQLVRCLVNGRAGEDRQDGLMILGDGAQRIYAGGFTLRQAGIEVRGRSSLLKINYRNTQEIVEAAMAVTGDGDVSDHGDDFKRGDAPAAALRNGARPLLVEAASIDAEIDWIAAKISELSDTDRVGLGDVGILVSTNRLVQRVLNGLADAGIAAQDLGSYEGQSVEAVKVGTYHRGKGLEFKAVFLPAVARGRFPPNPHDVESEDERMELNELAQSQLFVAMTRARDLLAVLYDRDPSDVLLPHLNYFDRISA